ncbi:hypothetical protein D3C85_959780 [compost metagenome]
MTVEGERRPDRAFLAGFSELAAQIVGVGRQGHEGEQTGGRGGQGQSFQLMHGSTPIESTYEPPAAAMCEWTFAEPVPVH